MDKKGQNFSIITKADLISFIFAILVLGLLCVWGSNLPLPYQLEYLVLISILFLGQKSLSPLGFGEETLKSKIILERENLCPGSNSNWQWASFRRLYDPSPFSLIIIVLFGVLINLPSFYFPWFKSIIPIINSADKAGFLNNFIAIHAGIGAIIFALLIFVAESLRDDTKERASVLLKESLLFPLTLLEIITFLAFIGFDNQNFLIAIPVFIVGCLAIYSLYKLMRVLLSPYTFQEKRLNLLKDRVRRSINEALNERIGNNILHKLLNSDQISLSTGYFSRRDRRDSVAFKINEIGTVKDINMDVLMKIGELIEEQANSKGFSFFENKPKPLTSSPEQTELQGTLETEYYTKIQRWDATLTKFYHQKIDPESNVVLVINKKIANDDAVFENRVNELLKNLFKIGKEDNFSEETKLELESLRDQFVEAVQQVKLTKIDYFKTVYLSLTETFLDLINQCGGGYTPEQAKKEESADAFREGWPEMGWLDDHLRDIYKASIATFNKEIIRKVAFIPIAIAIRGIRKNDHFVFQKFIKYARSLHYEALELEESVRLKSLKEDMVYHSITWLKELGDYYIEPELENEPNKIQFAFRVLIELQAILKHSFDKNDFDSFEKALEALNSLLKRFKPLEEHPNAEHLTWELNHVTDQKLKEEIKTRIEEQKELEKAETEFNGKKKQLLFGFTSWIFKAIRRSNLDPNNKRRFFERLKQLQPQKIEELTDVFVKASDHDTQDHFGWDWWDVIPDGEVRTIDFGSDVEHLYILLVLELLSRKTSEEIVAINLPPSRALAFLAENNSSLKKKLDSINDIPNFDLYFSEKAKEKIEDLKTLLEKAKKQQEEKERIEIINRPLSPKKIEVFWELFIKDFYEQATLRSLFKAQGKFIDKSQGTDLEPASVDLVGLNQIDAKEIFFENWHVHYIGWGEQHGEGFARSEDISIYEKFSKKLEDKRSIPFIDFISVVEATLQSKKFLKPIILSPFAYRMELGTLRSSEKFVPRWHYSEDHKGFDKYPFYIGFLKLKNIQVPIFRIAGPKEKETHDACLIDMNNIGTFIQYPPIKEIEDKQFQRDIFMYKIIDLNLDHARRQKIIDERPKWLEEKLDPEAYLKSKVLINIYSKFEFKITDNQAGTYFKFESGNTAEL